MAFPVLEPSADGRIGAGLIGRVVAPDEAAARIAAAKVPAPAAAEVAKPRLFSRIGTSIANGFNGAVQAVNNNFVKPAVGLANDYVVKPAGKAISAVSEFVKPAVDLVNDKVVKPAGKVITAVSEFVKPAVDLVNDKVVKPVGNFIGGAARMANENILRPAGALLSKIPGVPWLAENAGRLLNLGGTALKQVPFLGAIPYLIQGAVNVYDQVKKGESWGAIAAEVGTSLAQAVAGLSGFIGFGAAEAGREVVRAGLEATTGIKIEKSATRQLGEWALGVQDPKAAVPGTPVVPLPDAPGAPGARQPAVPGQVAPGQPAAKAPYSSIAAIAKIEDGKSFSRGHTAALNGSGGGLSPTQIKKYQTDAVAAIGGVEAAKEVLAKLYPGDPAKVATAMARLDDGKIGPETQAIARALRGHASEIKAPGDNAPGIVGPKIIAEAKKRAPATATP